MLPLCGPDDLRWREILTAIAQAVGRRKLMLPAPAWGVSAAAALLDRFEAFPITRDQIRMLMEGNTCTENGFTALDITPRAFTAENLRYLADHAPSP